MTRTRSAYAVGEPFIGTQEIARVVATLEQGRITQGNGVREFEQRLEDYLEVAHVVACASGTAALHLALAGLGIGPGDEVLVPDVTFVATANAVSYTGATPVLVDVDPMTWCMCLHDAAKKVSVKTRVILPVHLYGVPCDMNQMHEFAAEHNLEVVEDAAQAFGGKFEDKACGTHGVCGTFSFYANKVITTGEGGAVVTNDATLAETLRFFRGQAQSPIRRFWHAERGFNYRMTDVHAAIGLAQLDRVGWLLEQRDMVIDAYRGRLDDHMFSPRVAGTAPWLYTAVLPFGKSLTRAERVLTSQGVEVRPVFTPMHRLPMYARPDGQFPNSCVLGDRGISLPTYPGLSIADVNHICDVMMEAIS